MSDTKIINDLAAACTDSPLCASPSSPNTNKNQDNPAILTDGDWIVLTDRRDHKHLFYLKTKQRFHFAGGFLDAESLLGQKNGVQVVTSGGDRVNVFRASLEEYIVLMKRAAQIITPKDMAYLIQWADIFPGATVVEAGLGSGALTLGLLRAVGQNGKVLAFELRKEFANCGQKNVLAWNNDLKANLEIRLTDVHQALLELDEIDRVVLDLPEPWLALAGSAKALRPGGIFIAYIPTIRQVDRLVLTALDNENFSVPEVIETWIRPWHADKKRLRPVSRMCAHTGFLVRMRKQACIKN